MPLHAQPRSLRFYLIALVTAVAVPLLGLVAALAIHSAQQERAALESGLVGTIALVAAGALLLALAIGIAVVLGRRIVAPIVSAADAADAMARGERPRLEPSIVKEVAQLNAAIEGASRVLREKEAARRTFQREGERAEKMFQLAVEASPIATLMADETGDVALANAQAERLFGYHREELLGMKVEQLVPPECRTAHIAKRADYTRAPAPRPMGVGRELYALTKSGMRVPVEVGLTPIDGGHGSSFVLASLIDITERKRAEDQRAELLSRTEAARAEAEAASHAKDEFLAMFGHELRNPLAALRSAIYVLSSPNAGSEQQAKVRAIIERQTAQLARLVEDLLDVARLTRGKIRVERKPVDLARVARQALDYARGAALRKGHELDVSQLGDAWVEGDQTRLQQVIVNLLDNAIKYTPEGGRIALELKREDTQAVLSVWDNGPGIPASLLPHVFEVFRQGERPLDRGPGGLGVGLTIVRQLVDLHGGTIEVRSEPGKGACFIVHLPAVDSGRAIQEERGAERVPCKRVLLVEDNHDVRTMLQSALELDGHLVRSAQDGLQALKLCTHWTPDVVLLDIGLPGMDGYEVAKQLRQTANGAHALLVALTGYAAPADRARAQQSGFDVHLAKPVDPRQLAEVMAAGSAAVVRG